MVANNKNKTQQLVEVIFDDPAEFDTNYDKIHNPIECRTIGWLEEKNHSLIRISWLKEEYDMPYVGLAIPMGCVKKIMSLQTRKPIFSLRRSKN